MTARVERLRAAVVALAAGAVVTVGVMAPLHAVSLYEAARARLRGRS